MGELIAQKLEETGMTQERLGQLINSSKQNVGNILTRPSIDSDLLKRIAEAMECDFFSVYYQDGFLQAAWEKELAPFTSEIARLKAEVNELETKLAEKKETLADYKKSIDSNASAIMMLEEVHQYKVRNRPEDQRSESDTTAPGEKQNDPA
jgi:transcriptional regulator with XRE-family HTH domain